MVVYLPHLPAALLEHRTQLNHELDAGDDSNASSEL